MPTYEYYCNTCGATFDWFQSIKDPKLTLCPESVCASANHRGTGLVERKISGGTGLIFNGDGFYLTDYVRSGGDGKSNGKASAQSGERAENSPSGVSDGAADVPASSSSSSTTGTSSASASSGRESSTSA
jgi:putative FmdB family regulatory protein